MSTGILFEKLGLEWWYNAHFVYGAIQMFFIPILLPTFILEYTGSATLVGILMGIIGLGGLSAPILGGLADKFMAHRWVQLAGLLSYVIGGLLFAFGGDVELTYFLGAISFGVGSASLLMLNPAFIVSAEFTPKIEAKKLASLNQIAILGSLVAGIALSLLTSAGLSYQGRFLCLSSLAAGSLLLTFFTNRIAASRIKVASPAANENSKSTFNIKILFSAFGAFLIAVFLSTFGHGVITGQYPNYMKAVFSIDSATTSVWLSVSAVVSLLALGPVGFFMGKKGPTLVFLGSLLLKIAAMLLLILLAFNSGTVIFYLPLIVYIAFLQGIAFVDMVQPALAVRISSYGAGITQGLLLFSIAIGYASGNIIGGVSADILGFQSLTWLVSGAMGGAFFLGLFVLKK